MNCRIAFFGYPGYGGIILKQLMESGGQVELVYAASKSRLHRWKKLYKRYGSTHQKRKQALERLRQKHRPRYIRPLASFGLDPAEVARSHGIPVYDGSEIHTSVCPERLRAHAIDVILVASFGEILPRTVLASPRLAAINMHPALLPRYRGGFPEFAAVLAGESEAGVTFHLMEKEFDAGNLLLQRRAPIATGETTLSLKNKMALLACDMIPEILSRIEARDLGGIPQDPSSVTYCRLPAGFDRIEHTSTVAYAHRLLNACYDLEDIGRPHVVINGERIDIISCGANGLKFQLADGVIHFDQVGWRRRTIKGEDLPTLSAHLAQKGA